MEASWIFLFLVFLGICHNNFSGKVVHPQIIALEGSWLYTSCKPYVDFITSQEIANRGITAQYCANPYHQMNIQVTGEKGWITRVSCECKQDRLTTEQIEALRLSVLRKIDLLTVK